MLSRRDMLGRAIGLALGTALLERRLEGAAAQGQDPLTGVDAVMENVLREFNLAGGAVAIARRGDLVHARGYGLANVAVKTPVTTDTLFSIASVTKAISGVSVLKLVEDGKLKLEARLVDVLKDIPPLPGKTIIDPRFREITIHQLLYHAAGFPGHFKPKGEDATEVDEEGDRAEVTDVYRALMSRPLEFTPGTKAIYSNAGFSVLQVVIAHVSGQGYERYVRERILQPMGITDMQMEKAGGYIAGEAHRYRPGGRQPAARNVANWLATPSDLVRFISHVAGSGSPTFLSRRMTAVMLAPPSPPVGVRRNGTQFGLGWDSVRRFPQGERFSKNGGKPGIQAWLEHVENGIDWAFMFNTSPPEGRNSRTVTVRRMHDIFERIRG